MAYSSISHSLYSRPFRPSCPILYQQSFLLRKITLESHSLPSIKHLQRKEYLLRAKKKKDGEYQGGRDTPDKNMRLKMGKRKTRRGNKREDVLFLEEIWEEEEREEGGKDNGKENEKSKKRTDRRKKDIDMFDRKRCRLSHLKKEKKQKVNIYQFPQDQEDPQDKEEQEEQEEHLNIELFEDYKYTTIDPDTELRNMMSALDWMEDESRDILNDDAFISFQAKDEAAEEEPSFYVLKQRFTPTFFTIVQETERLCVLVFRDDKTPLQFRDIFQTAFQTAFQKLESYNRSNDLCSSNKKIVPMKRPNIPLEIKIIDIGAFAKSCHLMGLDILIVEKMENIQNIQDMQENATDDMFIKLVADRECNDMMRGALDYLYWSDGLPLEYLEIGKKDEDL